MSHPCNHNAPVTLTPAVMTDLLRAWSTAGLNVVHVETKCTECGADVRVVLVRHDRGEGGGKSWAHVEAFPSTRKETAR